MAILNKRRMGYGGSRLQILVSGDQVEWKYATFGVSSFEPFFQKSRYA